MPLTCRLKAGIGKANHSIPMGLTSKSSRPHSYIASNQVTCFSSADARDHGLPPPQCPFRRQPNHQPQKSRPQIVVLFLSIGIQQRNDRRLIVNARIYLAGPWSICVTMAVYSSTIDALQSSSLDGKTSLLLFGLVAAAVILILWQSSSSSSDPREPPVFRPKIPVIGHLIGIMQHEADYLQKLR